MAKAAKSVFGSAPTIVTATAGKGRKAPERPIAGIERLSALRAVQSWLKAYEVQTANEVKAIMCDEFIDEGMKLNRRPENFTGVEGFGTASCQLRASSSNLPEDQVTFCKTHGVDLVVETKVEQTLIFNPEYANDPKVIALLDKKFAAEFAKIEDDRGPIILQQEGVIKTSVSEAGQNHLFTLDDKAAVRELVGSAFTLAIRAKMDTNGDLRPALDVIGELLGTDFGAALAQEAATDPEALSKKADGPKRPTSSRAKKAA